MPPRKATTAAKAGTTVKPPSKSSVTKSTAVAKKTAAPSRASKSRKASATKEPEADSDDAPEELDEVEEDDEVDEVEPPKTKKPAAKAATKKAAPAPKKSARQAAITNGTAATKDDTSDVAAKKPSKSAPKKQVAKINGSKRKAPEESPDEDLEAAQIERPAKKPRAMAAAKKTAGPAGPKLGNPINEIPTQKLDVFVFGEGSSGELGLGSSKFEGKKPIDVKRPRINHNLAAETVGAVQVACGGMHAIALTHDNRILTWGVNDDKALGRDTAWDGGTRDVDDEDSDDDDDDSGLNPHESTPGEVDMTSFTPGTKIVQVAATDSASFVLTEDGYVYGWGTFRGSDGIIGFSDEVRVQPTPIRIPDLKNISRLACGSNHVLAMDKDGKVLTWGSGGQYQLGRKPISRHGGPLAGLKPEACGRFTKRHHAVDIAAGSYHSFYLDNNGKVWAWGLNNYSQTGHTDDTGKDDAMVLLPKVVDSLREKSVARLAGGEHHSVAATEDGELLTWGRVDGHQVGHASNLFTEDNAVFDESGKPRILTEPTIVEGIKAMFIAAGTDTSFALDDDGKVYSWGFSANYQTGQGTTDDIEIPTLIDNTAVRGRKLVWAGAGGQYSIVAAVHGDNVPNGH
ncbi:regulator of chromosome condensation 1/beta-lactamase-inhibitor protein II [Pseudomassariella vexata]|uniref:Regulator of chromosome condensation 1/beta-lactamase-inhibitor protein II n=1 Tax=Pseudomassariella vexata TaxID=1141098 RepID=A0A1Y2DQ78_9PEZI|nr:regulator of chromosome condensation 1/beta-lactamase-inhibitor protein II [Pseudomassariella vexata]ORY61410.1 regulator of chromosome condensation 1/beta-lactamase-inhibitor protein II [Pseudomassariella vexata]